MHDNSIQMSILTFFYVFGVGFQPVAGIICYTAFNGFGGQKAVVVMKAECPRGGIWHARQSYGTGWQIRIVIGFGE